MNRSILKKYAPQARRDFIQAVTDRSSYFGLTKTKTEPVTVEGDTALIGGRAFPKQVAEQRKRLEERIARRGFDQVMETIAYTWFNRLVAIRYMELHGYLEHGYRVLSTTNHTNEDQPGDNPHSSSSSIRAIRVIRGSTPEILEHADSVDLPGLNPQQVIDLKLAGNKDAELYRMLLIAQCNALHQAMPFLFERIDDETELLLPDNLLHSDSLIRTLVGEIPEEDWREVEIIGWLYQFYISEKKDEVIGKVVKSEDIPAATQLFTPNWIVKYLVQNSLGRQWVATYPNSPLKGRMEYYIEPAEQTPEVQEQLGAITPDSLDPEELTLLDPACGSGHILVEAYDLLKAIYQERGYPKKDIPRLILTKNLYGLEIDDRAAQLAAFALMMKARADDRKIFTTNRTNHTNHTNGIQPQVLSIQESKGLDAKEITEALNAPILKTELPPSGELFEEMAEEKAGLFSKKNLAVKGDISQADVAQLIELFEHGKTFGSLIQVPEKLAEKLPAIARRVEDVIAHGGMFEQVTARTLKPIVEQGTVLSRLFDTVGTNPPYMGSKGMNSVLKAFTVQQHPGSSSDLFSAFTERVISFVKHGGTLGLMTPFTWMFIKSYERLRSCLTKDNTLLTLIHPEYHAFFESAYVPICTFVFQRTQCLQYKGAFIDLRSFYGEDLQPVKTLEAIKDVTCHWRYSVSSEELQKIPGRPIAYWVSKRVRGIFERCSLLEEVARPTSGMTTGNNDEFLRIWAEVSSDNFATDCRTREEAVSSRKKWFPYNKGGEFRKWFGNNAFVVNWRNDGEDIISSGRAFPRSKRFYFQPCITWSFISSSFFGVRCSDHGFVFDVSGASAFPDADSRDAVLALLCSKLAFELMKAMNPTLNFQVGNVASLPYCVDGISRIRDQVSSIVEKAVEISRSDWNSCETSWDFQRFCLLDVSHKSNQLKDSEASWLSHCESQIKRLKAIEEENNRLFLKAYDLEGEFSPEVPEDQITLYRPNREEDIQRLISYAIGCMMGRYSLDKPGLIYAHSGGDDFWKIYHETHEKHERDKDGNYSCDSCHSWSAFPPDQDGLIPITEHEWFKDDAANRLENFIATAWPKDHLEENLKFIAESLGQNRSESARETIRRYLAASGAGGFYKHHLSLYKKRPIYWLFSSGKQRAFGCLVYLHRYNAGTLSRMRTEYVIPLSGKIASRIDQLEDDIEAASSTSHQKKLTKERDTLVKHREELQTFDEKLRHFADQRIELDLDDGVKVNYGKFGDLLAEVKAVTGKKAET